MRVEQWMTVNPLTVRPHDSVAHARALLKEHRINQLPVTLNGRLVGIVTDRDLRDAMGAMYAAAEASGNPSRQERRAQGIVEDIAIEAVMTANAITIEPHDTMERTAVVMRRERIGALPVVHRGRVAGNRHSHRRAAGLPGAGQLRPESENQSLVEGTLLEA
jgi:CBS domain-containing protein